MRSASELIFTGIKMDKRDVPVVDEAELISRIVNGEQALFRHLVSEYKNMVFAMIMRQTGDFSLAEELTQESFIKAYNNLKHFRAEAKFSTWLITIAINHTSSYFSSRRYKETIRTDSFEIGKHEMSANSIEENQERQQSIEQFRKCLASLGERFQQVVVLCALEEKSYQETAEIAKVPVGTVRSRLNKARLLLKDCMAKA